MFVYTTFLALNSLSGDKKDFYPLCVGRITSYGRFIFCFQGAKEGQSVLFAPANCQLTLIKKNNQYAKVAYFGMACSEPHKYLAERA